MVYAPCAVIKRCVACGKKNPNAEKAGGIQSQGGSRIVLLQSLGNAGSGFLRLSRKGNNMKKILFFQEFTLGEFLNAWRLL